MPRRDAAKTEAERKAIEEFLRKAKDRVKCPLGPVISRDVCLRRQAGEGSDGATKKRQCDRDAAAAQEPTDYTRHRQRPGCWFEFCMSGSCPMGAKVKQKVKR